MADPLARLAAIRRGLSPAEWTRVGAMIATVVGPQRRRLGDAGRGAGRALPHQQDDGVRRRHRGARLHPRHAARVRRRPHRRDRQHHPQARRRGQAPAVHRVLLLPRSLQRRVRARGAAELRHPGARRPAAQQRLGPAVHDQHHRHLRVRLLPVPDRGVQHRHPGRDPQGVPRDALRRLRRRAAGGAAQQARPDEPLPRPAGPPGGHPVEDVPDRVPVRPGLRHRHRGGAARAGGHGRGRRPAVLRDLVAADPVRRRDEPVRHDRRLLHELRLRLGVRQAGPQGLLQPDHHRPVRLRRAVRRRDRTARPARPRHEPERLVLVVHGELQHQYGGVRHRRGLHRDLGHRPRPSGASAGSSRSGTPARPCPPTPENDPMHSEPESTEPVTASGRPRGPRKPGPKGPRKPRPQGPRAPRSRPPWKTGPSGFSPLRCA